MVAGFAQFHTLIVEVPICFDLCTTINKISTLIAPNSFAHPTMRCNRVNNVLFTLARKYINLERSPSEKQSSLAAIPIKITCHSLHVAHDRSFFFNSSGLLLWLTMGLKRRSIFRSLLISLSMLCWLFNLVYCSLFSITHTWEDSAGDVIASRTSGGRVRSPRCHTRNINKKFDVLEMKLRAQWVGSAVVGPYYIASAVFQTLSAQEEPGFTAKVSPPVAIGLDGKGCRGFKGPDWAEFSLPTGEDMTGSHETFVVGPPAKQIGGKLGARADRDPEADEANRLTSSEAEAEV
ncbi:hypothetical protein ACMD2_05052 [Ananas comosus]|uniref:Uncharacterized protein n=1 Tax=Ananas comosus TaxID=4615 RepID=A0A199W9I8_ANACO|nr:hypothetical protein ACMD2_05052 [Ananas comosus]